MPYTQTPSSDPHTSPEPPPSPPFREHPDLYDARHWETAYRHFDEDAVPQILLFLQDDLTRSRRREAAWLSVVVHLLVILLLVYVPKRPVASLALKDPMKDKDLTFLELPPDLQKVTKRPDTNIISDKDRIATSKTPRIDPKELKKIIDSGRAGRPGPQVPPAQQASQAPAPNPAQAQPQQQQQVNPPQANNQTAQLHAPPQPQQRPTPQINFKTGGYVGSQTSQAAAAVAAGRGSPNAGEGGDFGADLGQGARAQGQLEVLSDTMGVDFGPYLSRVVQNVRQNWYTLIPESAKWKKGKVSIQFVILKDGSVSGMQLFGTSQDTALDRAAWGGITASNPFPPLPTEFKGPYLALRFSFYYNPGPGEIR
jgi:TonB family protein